MYQADFSELTKPWQQSRNPHLQLGLQPITTSSLHLQLQLDRGQIDFGYLPIVDVSLEKLDKVTSTIQNV